MKRTIHDPKEFLERREALAIQRLKRRSHELVNDARVERLGAKVAEPRPVRWIRRHPIASLAGVTGLGYLLAPRLRRQREKKGATQRNVARITIAGQIMVIARLVDSVTRLVRGWSPGVAASSANSATAPSPANGTRVPPAAHAEMAEKR